MNIGDLFLRVLADDKGFAADLNQKAGKAGDQAGATLGQRMSGGFKKAGSGLVAGLGLGAGVAAFSALDTAVSKTIGFLGDAVAAAREDQASIVGLSAALKANIPGWDGNTDAIERTIAARMRLGFTDDEQRKSMELLVGATHDVSKALDIQRVAMDLAVRKHISLEEASTALIKVEGGQFRALKALGIILPKNATATEALAAAQRVVAGAAEAEAATDNGKLKAAQIALGERVEKLGYTLLPIVTEAMLAVAEAAGPVVDGLAGIVQAAKDADAFVKQYSLSAHAAGEETDFLGDKTTPLGGLLHLLADEISGVASEARNAAPPVGDLGKYVKGAGDLIESASGLIVKAFAKVGTKAGDTSIDVGEALSDIVKDFNDTRTAIETAGQGVADAMFDPIIAKAELTRLELDAKRQRNIRDSKDSNAVEKQDAIDKLNEIGKHQIEVLTKLATFGDTVAQDTLLAMGKTALATAKLTREQRANWDILIAKIHAIRIAALYAALAISGMNPTYRPDPGNPPGKARGGYIPPGWSGRVGEEGEEGLTMFPGGGAWVTSHGASGSVPSGSSAASSGSGNTFNIYNPVPHAADEDIGRILRRTAALGIG